MLSDLDPLARTLITLGTLAGLFAAFWRWVRPRLRRTTADTVAVRDAILGRDAIVDSITGREISPALPGIGVRMATTEQRMTVLAEAVSKLADSHQHMESLDRRTDDHERRIKALEEGAVERVVARAESLQAWRAVEAVAGQPGPEPDSRPELDSD